MDTLRNAVISALGTNDLPAGLEFINAIPLLVGTNLGKNLFHERSLLGAIQAFDPDNYLGIATKLAPAIWAGYEELAKSDPEFSTNPNFNLRTFVLDLKIRQISSLVPVLERHARETESVTVNDYVLPNGILRIIAAPNITDLLQTQAKQVANHPNLEVIIICPDHFTASPSNEELLAHTGTTLKVIGASDDIHPILTKSKLT